MVFYPSDRDVEFDWVIRPGADPSLARLRVEGAGRVSIDRNGDLVLTADGVRIAQRRPVAYQVIAGQRRLVSAAYTSLGPGEFGLKVGDYDPARELVVDPVLQWLSYMGGSRSEVSPIIKAAADGGVYLAFTTSSDYLYFPSASPTFLLNKTNYWVCAVAKLNKDGNLIERLAYLGGASSASNNVYAMALGSDGAIYLGGTTTAADFPLKNAFRSKVQATDGFVLKMTAQFDLVYSSLIGGSSTDIVRAIAVDPSGRLNVTGDTSSSDFMRIKALETTVTSGFMTRLDPTGTPEFSSYLWQGGGNQNVYGRGIAADSTGATYLLVNSDFNTAYLAKISADGAKYEYKHVVTEPGTRVNAIYFNSLALGLNGTVYVAGYISVTSPTSVGSAYVGVVDASGSSRTDTFKIDFPSNCRSKDCGELKTLALDADGSIVFAGNAATTWPTVNGFASFGSKVGDSTFSVFLGKWKKSTE